MKPALRAVMLASALLVGCSAPAFATITNIWGPPGEICFLSQPCGGGFNYPIRQGRTIVLEVQGQFVDLSTGYEPDAGLNVTKNSASSSDLKLNVTVQPGATPGIHTIKIHYAVELNGPDLLHIMVLRNGKVTGVPQVTLSTYFTSANVTFQGTDLGNAGVAVIPDAIASYSVGGSSFPSVYTLTQSPGTATMSSSSDTQDVVAFNFTGGPFAEAKATVVLFDKQVTADICLQHRVFCYDGIDSPSTHQSTAHVVGPNAVSSITFPLGSSVSVGNTLTAHVKLVKPSVSGDTVKFEILPSTSFATSPGSGVVFNTHGGQNTVSVPAGDQAKDVSVQVIAVPTGCNAACNATFETRMVNFTVDQLPFLRQVNFQIRAKAPELIPAWFPRLR